MPNMNPPAIGSQASSSSIIKELPYYLENKMILLGAMVKIWLKYNKWNYNLQEIYQFPSIAIDEFN